MLHAAVAQLLLRARRSVMPLYQPLAAMLENLNIDLRRFAAPYQSVLTSVVNAGARLCVQWSGGCKYSIQSTGRNTQLTATPLPSYARCRVNVRCSSGTGSSHQTSLSALHSRRSRARGPRLDLSLCIAHCSSSAQDGGVRQTAACTGSPPRVSAASCAVAISNQIGTCCCWRFQRSCIRRSPLTGT